MQDLIRIRSYSGEEEKVVERLKEFYTACGFDEVRTQTSTGI